MSCGGKDNRPPRKERFSKEVFDIIRDVDKEEKRLARVLESGAFWDAQLEAEIKAGAAWEKDNAALKAASALPTQAEQDAALERIRERCQLRLAEVQQRKDNEAKRNKEGKK